MATEIHSWEIIVRGTEDGAEVLIPFMPEPIPLRPGETWKLTAKSAVEYSTQQDQPEVAIEQGGDAVETAFSSERERPHVAGAGVAIEGDPGPHLSPEDRQRATEEVAALTSPAGILDLIHRFVQAGAPLAEDGGSNAEMEAFNEVFVDACFVSHWLDRQSTTGKEDCEG